MIKNFLLLLALSSTFVAAAQITFTRADYDLQPGDTVFSRILNPDSIAVPEVGEDMIWDYTAVDFEQQAGNIEDIGTHPDFPTANIVEMVNIRFIGDISQETHFIERLDDDGHKVLGREVFPRPFSIVNITGGTARDSFEFLAGVCVYEEPLYEVKFPLNYADTFSSSFTLNTPFTLSLPILSYDKAPSLQRAYLSYQYDVAGWGELTLPNPLVGGGQKTFEALLLKRSLTRVDSFFINNEPAPPLLLSFFFQEQGQISQTTTYTFWVKGLNRSALSMIVNETTGQVIAASMSRNVNNFITTSTKFIDKPIAVSAFPNPTSDYLQLSFEKESSQPWRFTLFNSQGQVVQQQSLWDAPGNVITTIELLGDLPSGNYFFLLENEEGLGVASQKIVLKR